MTASVALVAVAIGVSSVASGHMRFVFFPRVDSEVARGSLAMPEGTPFAVTQEYVRRMSAAAERLRQRHVDPESGESVIRHVLATAGSAGSDRGQSHLGRVMFEIVSPEDRSSTITSAELVREWRQEIGPLPGAKEVNFRAEIGRSSNPIELRLAGHDLEALRRVSERLKLRLADYPGVFDITDSFDAGKLEVRMRLKPEAETLDLDLQSLASQVREGFFGAEAQRIQRGRDDLRVMVRYADEERSSLGYLEDMRVRTASGDEVPFAVVADVELGRGFSTIQRIDRRRTVNVIADVNKDTADVTAIYADLARVLEEVERDEPTVSASLAGEAEEQADSFGGLFAGLLLVLCVTYALLAVAFRSYAQPLAVMCVIPTGWVGALLGHVILGMTLSIFSLMGMLALTGVVVNDSLVMVEFINRRRREGVPLFEAARISGVARFRPILLTSLTTVAGLVPLIFFERSTQAQFLIPMAVSLAFGVLFATCVTLLVLPVAVLLLEDAVRFV
ncbi:MAG: efflux RND transporter permease subunit, partial [Planctomycetota bacterium]